MAVSDTKIIREDRHPGETYEDVLARDSRRAPEHFRSAPDLDIGVDGIPVDRFFDPAYAALEATHMWSRVWQVACREEDIPNAGDYRIYEIVDKSFIVTRTRSGAIKAYYNSCPHRARKLVTEDGRKSEFRCPFHALAWNIDGTPKDNLVAWDFPQWGEKGICLPEALIDTWGGFVFLNMDKDAIPLKEFLGPIIDHFAPYEWEKRYATVHVRKTVKANWKVVAEAFMESIHTVGTHPQIVVGAADLNAQYDILSKYVSRNMIAQAVPSPWLSPQPSEAEVNHYMHNRGSKRTVLGEGDSSLPDGLTAREFFAERVRQGLTKQTGRDYGHASDAEMLDAMVYNVFPNFSIWAGYNPQLVYLWRPHSRDPEKSIFDFMVLAPHVEGRTNPRPAEIVHVDAETSLASMREELGLLAEVLQQDMDNMPYVQEGLRASGTGIVNYTRYAEARIRHTNHVIHEMVEEGIAREAKTIMKG